MVYFNNTDDMKGVNLLAFTYDNNKTKDGKESQYLDVQVDYRDSKLPAEESDFHLYSKLDPKPGPNGEKRYNNGVRYYKSQYDAIKKIAGPNREPRLNREGEKVGDVYAFKADLMRKQTEGLGWQYIVNTKTLEQSDFRMDTNTLENQRKAASAHKQVRLAREAEEAKTKEQEPAVDAQTTAKDEPITDGSVAEKVEAAPKAAEKESAVKQEPIAVVETQTAVKEPITDEPVAQKAEVAPNAVKEESAVIAKDELIVEKKDVSSVRERLAAKLESSGASAEAQAEVEEPAFG